MALLRHENFHSDVRDAQCEFCQKTYRRKETLKAHLLSVHKLSETEARVSAKLKLAPHIPIIKEGEEIRVPVHWAAKPETICGFCSKKYSRREYLTSHLVEVHGKTEEEAKGITGLESRRSLPVATRRTRTDGLMRREGHTSRHEHEDEDRDEESPDEETYEEEAPIPQATGKAVPAQALDYNPSHFTLSQYLYPPQANWPSSY
jgi:hypothetical protein